MAGKRWLARDWQGQSGNQTAGPDCTTLAGWVSLRALALLLFGKPEPDSQNAAATIASAVAADLSSSPGACGTGRAP